MRRVFRWVWRKKWRRWAALGLFVLVAGSIGSVEATSQSSFCNSCHIMGTYYDSWKHSAHKDIECVKCHIEPGANSFVAAKLNGLGQVVDDVLNRTSTKPSASVSQLSCTRSGCHSVETLNSHDVDNGTFRFKHAKHLGQHHLGVEITCGTCHSHVKGDEHFEVNTGVCVTCHLIRTDPGSVVKREEPAGEGGAPEPPAEAAPPAAGDAPGANGPTTPPPVIRMAVRESRPMASLTEPGAPPLASLKNGEKAPPNECVKCHEPPEGEFEYNGLKVDHAEFIGFGAACESCHRGVTAPPPAIDDGACLQCHTFGVERALPAKEMHQVHTLGRHKIECFACHGTVRHGPVAQTMSFQQFDCRRCHVDQHAVQRRAYLSAAAGEPPAHAAATTAAVNPMFLAHVDCTGCHVESAELEYRPGSGAQVRRASPQACDACHQEGFGEQMVPMWQDTTKRLYEQATKDLAQAEPVRGEKAVALLEEARQLVNLVRIDGSWGVHNPKYTQRLLEQAREKTRQARAESLDAGPASAGEGGGGGP